jgi:hypothetical protein
MRRFVVALALVAGMPLAALAHHGWSSYDANTVLTLKGAILESRYQNPHGELELQDQGKRWLVVLAPPSRMQSRGLPREDLAVGKIVTVVGYPNRTVPAEMRAERITVGDKTVELR